MINFNQIFPLLHCRCVLCDLDGTLVETDEANFLAYQEAIYEVVNVEIEANGERFTKENIKEWCPYISEEEFKEIVKYKNDAFEKYLGKTKPNLDVIKLVEILSYKCRVFLCSNSNARRGNDVLAYHNLDRLFNNKYYNILPLNKYSKVLSLYNIASRDVLVIENDEEDIRDALNAGILTEQIIDVRWEL